MGKKIKKWTLFIFLASIWFGPHHAVGQRADSVVHVAVLVFPEVEIQDLAGPADVFIKANRFTGNKYNVFTLSVTEGVVTSEKGLVKLIPTYSAWDDPEIDILIVPGAAPLVVDSLQRNPVFTRVLGGMMQKSAYTLAVCTGAYLIAETGRLDGKLATTHYMTAGHFADRFPNVEVVQDVRFVDAGDIVTASGITSGIDGALFLLRKLSGNDVGDQVAEIMQYEENENYLWPERKER